MTAGGFGDAVRGWDCRQSRFAPVLAIRGSRRANRVRTMAEHVKVNWSMAMAKQGRCGDWLFYPPPARIGLKRVWPMAGCNLPATSRHDIRQIPSRLSCEPPSPAWMAKCCWPPIQTGIHCDKKGSHIRGSWGLVASHQMRFPRNTAGVRLAVKCSDRKHRSAEIYAPGLTVIAHLPRRARN
jgi:hypothetical protein